MGSEQPEKHTPDRGEGPVCPRCGGPLKRMHRRPIDRLTSLFKPVHRYRCSSRSGWGCGWEGNLPVDRVEADTKH